MTFKPAIWRPVAAVLSALNVAAMGFAAGLAEPWHAAAHAGLALGFGYWAQRLRPRVPELGVQAQLDEIEAEMSSLRRELGETQERLDFAERMLAQGREARRVGPEP